MNVNYSGFEHSCTMQIAIINQIKKVFDPEMPINIWDLGLVYGVNIHHQKNLTIVRVVMTFTSPNCPFVELILADLKKNILDLECVDEIEVEVVWDPIWSRDSLDDEQLLELDLL
jgi:metal-sulfur cluster biosynthetic enzyme